MGWKNLKEAFGITHTVHVCDGRIWIGSGAVSQIISISLTGDDIKSDGVFSSSGPFRDYLNALSSRPDDVRVAVMSPDVFGPSHTVYTHRDGKIVTTQAEHLGWPNCTHDGLVQYENTFSTDIQKVVQWAKKDCMIQMKWAKRKLAEIEASKRAEEKILADAIVNLEDLNQKYPDVQAQP